MVDEVLLKDLKADEIPDELKASSYWDFKAYPFEHDAIFAEPWSTNIIDVLGAIGDYAEKWLDETISAKGSAGSGEAPLSSYGSYEVIVEEGAVFQPALIWGATGDEKPRRIYVEAGARVVGANIFLNEGDIYVGADNVVEPGVGIKGPTIIGKGNEIRTGAYFRGNCIIGDGGTLRGELKNTILMGKANFPHPSYLGDSICGHMTHFGNQGTAANLGIFNGLLEGSARRDIVLKLDEGNIDLGRPKVGIIMGDFAQVGCSSVADPATFLRPYTITYPLSRLSKGFYGPDEILKNKPLEKGIIERVAFDRTGF